MSLETKLDLLGAGARYDASCASSGSLRGANPSGVCHSWSSDGRCISLLKVLLTNFCIYDCAYCANRSSNDMRRSTFTTKEITSLTMDFYRRNYIEGLFLSSGIMKTPDYTMELLIEAARRLRVDHGFQGYLHLKLIPGADLRLVGRAVELADRVSVNIELPTSQSLGLLAPQKTKEAILRPMGCAAGMIYQATEEAKKSVRKRLQIAAGQSTQLIIGASGETDRHIVSLSESLYRKMRLKRVYYSAYVPVNHDRRLPSLDIPPLLREHRLYQADWLLRYYGFTAEELLDEEHPWLDPDFDPKTAWALRHPHLFPLEVNTADYEMLLRVPGIGRMSAGRILRARRQGALKEEDLPKLSIVMKRARHFITVRTRYLGGATLDPRSIRAKMAGQKAVKEAKIRQLSLFPLGEERRACLAGEL